MLLTLPISDRAQASLKAKAEAAGVDIETYAATIVEQTVAAPLSVADISGPVADAFARTGLSEDELGELLEEAKHATRAGSHERRDS